MLEFILTVLRLELTPGPNMAYLATLTLDRGRRAGSLATAGVAAGLSVHAIVAALGLGVLISQAPMIYNLLCGVAYLLYLAWETWQSNGKTLALPCAAMTLEPPADRLKTASNAIIDRRVINGKRKNCLKLPSLLLKHLREGLHSHKARDLHADACDHPTDHEIIALGRRHFRLVEPAR